MKFFYEYRTSDNEKHSGVVSAADRDAAYGLLKKSGVKPSRLVEAPGVFNKLFGKGKRWMVIGVLSLAVALALAVAWKAEEGARTTLATFDSTTRRQVIGDVAVIDKGVREGWAFSDQGERYLAAFAIPGVSARVGDVTDAELASSLSRKSEAPETDGIEMRQVRAMVEGLKDELREFLSAGGTVAQYRRRLLQRQEEELAYLRRAQAELDKAVVQNANEKAVDYLVSRLNDSLRKMGIRPLVLPEKKSGRQASEIGEIR